MRKLATSIGITAAILAAITVTSVQSHDGDTYDSYSDHNSQCEVTLNYDVTVEPKKLTVTKGDTEIYRIEVDKLFVEGKPISLNKAKTKLLTQFSDEVSIQVPEVIDLFLETVDINVSATNMMLTPFLEGAAGAKLDEMLYRLEQKVEKVAFQNGDLFYLEATHFGATQSSLEDKLTGEYEQELDQLIVNSVYSMPNNSDSQDLSSDDDLLAQKMDTFSEKMENVGQEIELQMDSQTKDLEIRTDKMCERFMYLSELEQELIVEVPELAKYPLIDVPKRELLE